jgi:hypothetical protein
MTLSINHIRAANAAIQEAKRSSSNQYENFSAYCKDMALLAIMDAQYKAKVQVRNEVDVIDLWNQVNPDNRLNK